MKALYAGSFDPFTIGHLEIVKRALSIFGSLVIGIGYNENKTGEWPIEVRLQAIRDLFKDNKRVEVESYIGLTVEFAKRIQANVLVRGVRNGSEFEKEKELADINLEVGGISTVILPADPKLSFISSSMVRELLHNGFDVSKYIAGSFPVLNKENI